jgi:hypothetical protein
VESVQEGCKDTTASDNEYKIAGDKLLQAFKYTLQHNSLPLNVPDRTLNDVRAIVASNWITLLSLNSTGIDKLRANRLVTMAQNDDARVDGIT